MAKEIYRLPDEMWTPDVDAMIAAWRALGEPISELVGVPASGYGPTVSWSFDDRRRFLQLDVWFIKLVNAALAQRTELLEALWATPFYERCRLFEQAIRRAMVRAYKRGLEHGKK